MIIPRHRRFFEFKVDTLCYKTVCALGGKGVCPANPRWLFRSDIIGEPDALAAKKVLVLGLDDINARRKRVLWDATSKLCPTQSFPSHIIPFLRTCSRIGHCIRWATCFCTPCGQKRGMGSSTQWTWRLDFLWTVREQSDL